MCLALSRFTDHLIEFLPLGGGQRVWDYLSSYRAGEETEALRGEAVCPRSQRREWEALGLESKMLLSQGHLAPGTEERGPCWSPDVTSLGLSCSVPHGLSLPIWRRRYALLMLLKAPGRDTLGC